MSYGWSESDKNAVKVALERARRRAEDFVLREFHNQKIKEIDDLWALDLKIRDWRKEVHGKFYFSYDRVELLLHDCLKKGWSEWGDFQSLSEERLDNIKKGRTSSSSQPR
jgi:hypothetical protein